MKKNFYLFSLLAGLMFGMIGFSSCCSTDEAILPPEPEPAPAPEPEPEPAPDPYAEMLKTPLTLEAAADGTITFDSKASGIVTYKINDGEAQTIAANTSKDITVTAGQKVTFFGDNAAYATTTNYSNIKSTADFYAYGNIMSLVSSTDYQNATTLTADYAFYAFFANNTHLKNHPTKALILPATTLALSCYNSMFYGCTGLTSAPALPATTLTDYCYCCMFYGCTGLTTAPALPATSLKNYCYQDMFNGCTNLNYVKCMATDISALGCTSTWLAGVAATGNFVHAAGTAWPTDNPSGVPSGWAVASE